MQHHASRISTFLLSSIILILAAACSNGTATVSIPNGAAVLQQAQKSQMNTAIFTVNWNDSASTATGTGELSISPAMAAMTITIAGHGSKLQEQVVVANSVVYTHLAASPSWTQISSETAMINPVTQTTEIIPYDDFQHVVNQGQEQRDGINTWHLTAKIQISDPSAQDSNVQIAGLAELWVNVSNYFPVEFTEHINGTDSKGKGITLSVSYHMTQWNVPVTIATPNPGTIIQG